MTQAKFKPVCDGPEPVRPEGVLGVDVDDLAAGEAAFPGQLGGDTEGVGELRLAGPELAEHLGDGHRLQAATQQLVKLQGAGGQPENVLPGHGLLQGGLKTRPRPADLQDRLLHLVNFGLRKSLDIAQPLLGHHLDPSNCANAGCLQLLDVGHVDAVVLEHLDVLEEIFLVIMNHGLWQRLDGSCLRHPQSETTQRLKASCRVKI